MYDREVNFGQWENSDFPHFLESTGVLIMDRKRKIAYVALSQRAYKKVQWGFFSQTSVFRQGRHYHPNR